MVRVLHDKQQAIAALCARLGVGRLDVFGSAATTSAPARATSTCSSSPGPWNRTNSPAPTSVCSMRCGSCSAAMSTWSWTDAVTNCYMVREIERTKQLLYAA